MKIHSKDRNGEDNSKAFTRRDFLAKSLATAAALSFPIQVTAQTPSKSKRKKVIIIGAGLAGLSCAYELTKKGHDVVIFEASDRAGGRVKTLRKDFSDGVFAEAGAYWISKSHKIVNHYIDEFINDINASTRSEPMNRTLIMNSKKPFLYHIKGQPITTMIVPPKAINTGITPLRSFFPDLNRFPPELSLTEEEKAGDLLGLIIKLCGSFKAQGVSQNSEQELIEKFGSMSLMHFFRSHGFSNGAIELMRPWFGWSDDLDKISAYYALHNFVRSQDRCNKNPGPWFTLNNGMDALSDAFVKRLDGKIRYGVPVIGIKQDTDSATIRYQMRTGEERIESGDFLVCTIPFSTLRKIKNLPEFSSGKKDAIAQLSYASVSRIYLQFKERVWDREKRLNGYGFTDIMFGAKQLPRIEACGMNLLDMTYYNQETPQAILQAYLVGDQARLIALMSKDDRKAEFLRITKEVLFPEHRDELEKNYMNGTSICWDNEPWAEGAYVMFEPHLPSTIMHQIRKPEYRICFAGEHTSDFPGWMEGALQSGLRAASEIDSSVSPEVCDMKT